VQVSEKLSINGSNFKGLDCTVLLFRKCSGKNTSDTMHHIALFDPDVSSAHPEMFLDHRLLH